MATKAYTVQQLIDDYAQRIADAVGVEVADHDLTPGGFSGLLQGVANRLSPFDHSRGWLEECAADIDAVVKLGGDSPRAQQLLKATDDALYEARDDLESR